MLRIAAASGEMLPPLKCRGARWESSACGHPLSASPRPAGRGAGKRRRVGLWGQLEGVREERDQVIEAHKRHDLDELGLRPLDAQFVPEPILHPPLS